MKEITDVMNTYRECSRHLWNVYFQSLEYSCEVEDTYDQIRKKLFQALVSTQLGPSGSQVRKGRQLGASTLIVVPIASVPILIRRPSDDGNWYWDQEKNMRVNSESVQLEFQDYYDFSQYGVKD